MLLLRKPLSPRLEDISNSLCRLQRKACTPIAARVATLHGQVQARMLRVDLTSDNRIPVHVRLWARREASPRGAASRLPDSGLLVGFGHWEAEPRKQELGAEGGRVPPFPTALGHLMLTPSLPRGHFATHPTSPKLSNSQSCRGQGPCGCERALGTKSWSLEQVRGERSDRWHV